jgi:hypothetical protein
VLLPALDLWDFVALKGLDDLINGEGFLLIVLDEVLGFGVDGRDNVLLIGDLLEEEDFLFSTGDFEDLFSFWLGDKFEGTVGLLVGNEDFAVLGMNLLDGDGVFLDFWVQVGGLLEAWLELLGWLQEGRHVIMLNG